MKKIPEWLWGLAASVLMVGLFFWQVWIRGLVPVPVDALVGLYHPFRDAVAQDYPSGIPYKNFLITDPVLQQIPWRSLAVEAWKNFQVPGWNPYQFGGVPLLANPQAGAFSIFTLPFLVLPFSDAWVLGIFLQALLALWFTFLFLRSEDLSFSAALFGGIVFAFGGFALVWLTWGTILATALWLPLILFLINQKSSWRIIFIALSTALSLTSGHPQIAFYVLVVALGVSLSRRDFRSSLGIGCGLLVGAVQLLPSLGLILTTWRFSQTAGILARSDWFLPWRHLIQFVAPDFFGNPATLNYWGEFNYGEFVGYIGVIPLLLAILALSQGRKIWRPSLLVVLSLILALPTPLAQLPVRLNLPFLSTLKPTRLLFLTTFGLAWLAGVGWDKWRAETKNKLLSAWLLLTLVFLGLWTLVLVKPDALAGLMENLLVAKRNLLVPTVILAVGTGILWLKQIKFPVLKNWAWLVIFGLSLTDLFRFGWKFTPFAQKRWFFPETKVTGFLKDQAGIDRILTLDRRIFPPNLGAYYRLISPEGYDPIFPADYGELVAAWIRNQPDPSFFDFNRIVRPENVPHRLADLLGIRYVLSLTDLKIENFTKVFSEGQTRVYQNEKSLPRAFLVDQVVVEPDSGQALTILTRPETDLTKTAVVAWLPEPMADSPDQAGQAKVVKYEANRVVVKTASPAKKLLVLTDRFDDGWQVKIDGLVWTGRLLRTDVALRGAIVPAGNHEVEFFYGPKLFFEGLALAVVGLGLALGFSWRFERAAQHD